MKLAPLEIAGAFVIDVERFADERGYFARTFDRAALVAAGLEGHLEIGAISHNRAKGTIRGMHVQIAPHEETKIVSCLRGSLLDVIVDLRPGSPTYCAHAKVALDAASHRMVYVPSGVAHGFQTLEDDTLVEYWISHAHHPDSARGVRWDDPLFAIAWPLAPTVMAERDRTYPDYRRESP